ncbi:MAG: cellulase family glycosylhydrolase [Coriobacteriia bacterium]|nr:cellulase family glycosylhydrolase [Coriobacteriia bacterium]
MKVSKVALAALACAVALAAALALAAVAHWTAPTDAAAAAPQATSTPAAAEAQPASASTYLARPSTSGQLQVVGTQLCDAAGNPVQLRGVSTHGLAWFPQYVNQPLFDELSTQWDANVVRLALYTAEYGGYCEGGDQQALKDLVRSGVNFATHADMYVIVDWHILSDGNPLTYLDQAKAFFAEMSASLAGNDNVIYEICNEPNSGTTWDQVVAYANEVIPVIRANAPNAVVLVGTPTWCQEVDKAAAAPLAFDNLMYTFHFYAATHTGALRQTMAAAQDAGLPIFVSEYGICDASGNGALDLDQANQWIATLNARGISYVNWSLCNKAESASIIDSSCSKVSGFYVSELTPAGQWLLEMLTGALDLSGYDDDTGGGGGKAPTDVTRTYGQLEVTCTVAKTWSSGNATTTLYAVSVTNVGSAAVDSWSFTLPFTGAFQLSDTPWCCTYEAGDATLTLGNLDWNGHLESGATYANVGFAVTGAVVAPLDCTDLGHESGLARAEDTVSPTCAAPGSYNLVVRCSRCGEVLSSTPRTIPALTECAAQVFTDVSPSAWYHSTMDYVWSKRLLTGYNATTMAPDDTTNRAMFVTMLWRQAGCPAVAEDAPFQDLTASWYRQSVNWAYDTGVTSGLNATSFGPDQQVTREQIACFLRNYALMEGLDVSQVDDSALRAFPDNARVSSWARQSVGWATFMHVINGANGRIKPQASATRAECAAMLFNYNVYVAAE